MTDPENHVPSEEESWPQPRPRPDADKGREPVLVPGRSGTRLFSLAALTERIEQAFFEEHGDSSDAFREAVTVGQQMRLLKDTTDYVLAVESVELSGNDKADLLRRIYSHIFGYGPLDPFFSDPTVTTIALEGADKAAVRYGANDLKTVGPLFEDEDHLRTVIGRLLRQAQAEVTEDAPVVETGVSVNGRAVCLTVAAPPAAFRFNADIRVHPAAPPALAELVAQGFMTADAAHLIGSILMSPHGMIVAGDSEAGKTTLLGALGRALPAPETTAAVERAAAMRLPEGVQRLAVRWPVGVNEGISFADRVLEGLALHPAAMLLDEVRAEDAAAILPVLEADDAPRQLWAFRASPDSKRLQSALGMLARRAGAGFGEFLVHRLYERMPFVISVARVRDPETGSAALRLFSIAEWQPNPESEYPDYGMLFQYQEGVARATGRQPSRAVGLG